MSALEAARTIGARLADNRQEGKGAPDNTTARRQHENETSRRYSSSSRCLSALPLRASAYAYLPATLHQTTSSTFLDYRRQTPRAFRSNRCMRPFNLLYQQERKDKTLLDVDHQQAATPRSSFFGSSGQKTTPPRATASMAFLTPSLSLSLRAVKPQAPPSRRRGLNHNTPDRKRPGRIEYAEKWG